MFFLGFFRVFVCSIAIALLAISGFGQAVSSHSDNWTEIKDDSLGFSIQFPPDFLVDNDVEKSFMIAPVFASLPRVVDVFERPRIIAYKENAVLELSIFQLRIVSSAKDHLQYFIDPKADDFQNFQVGPFVGRKTNYETEKSQSTVILVAAKNRVVRIFASAPKVDKYSYEKFVLSLKLNGNYIFKNNAATIPAATASVATSSLKTSLEIVEALKNKTKAPDENVVRGKTSVVSSGTEPEPKYSRPLITLRRPNAIPSSATIGQKVEGTVKLKIAFLSTGKVGEIAVLSELPFGLTESALNSARNIVFLPAEMDGKKVDVSKFISYDFKIN
ncbi:MAG: energy transducer TonB [Acidobacteriota bacterium]